MKVLSASGTSRSRSLARALTGILVGIVAFGAAATIILAAQPAAKAGGVWPPPMTAEELELQRQVMEIAGTLKAPCCPNLTVAQHDSPTTLAMKREIHDMLKAGKGRGEIVAELKAKYGDVIVGNPISTHAKGLIWTGAIVGSLLIVFLIVWWMWTHEKEPVHLDQGHWMEEGEGGKTGGESLKRAS